jgi:2-furoate---CoA ligase
MFDVGTSFLAAVARNPDAVALVDADRRLTYAQWLTDITRLVGGLDALGLRRGDHLVVMLQNRLEMATLHWACQLAGIIVTPVNWRATADELDYFLGDADAKTVVYEAVSEAAVTDARQAHDCPRIAVDAAGSASVCFADLMASDLPEDLPRARPQDTSVMLYTSGTTGHSKGVPRSHYAERAAALAHVAQNLYAFGESTLGVMPLYHTMGVRSLLAMAFLNGCFVCLPRFDAAEALRLIAQERVTTLYLVPTLYHDLVHHPDFERTDISSVRKLGYAGASMTDGLLARVTEAFCPDLFVNHYGSSEIYTFTIEQHAAAKPGSAGKAGLNQEIRVIPLGSQQPHERVAVGEEGQIIARLDGDEAFGGYWQRPDADDKALHAGWYFTGDTGYVDADGDLFVTGRVDDMIISGGENISPVEIENVLSLHPAVAEVAVVGLADERWGQRVAAFIKRRGQVTAEELDRYCRNSSLADFKRPRNYTFIQEIPKSPVGKILRRLLISGNYDVES